VGPNGAGKSTLLKILAGVWKPDHGEIVPGSNVRVSYFAQHALEGLSPENTILQEGQSAATTETAGMVRDLLGAFGFSGDSVQKKVSVLSGGEKMRVAMAKLLLNPAGVLLLDEPTNHLDMDTREVLEEALRQFEGVVIMVSHDRHFINEVANRTIHIENGVATDYPGNYDYYRWKRDSEMESEEVAVVTTDAGSRKDVRRLAAELRQRKALELKELKPRLQKVEAEIARLESLHAQLKAEMASPELYVDKARAQITAQQYRETEALLEEIMMKWEEVGAAVDTIESRYRAEEEELQR